MIDSALVDAYLDRLELDREPPSIDGLIRLHRSHVEHVPYETVWIHLGEAWDIDPVRAAERIARRGRGGYCFHVNGAFTELLRALGYRTTIQVGGVHGPAGPSGDEMADHLVVVVHELPDDDHPEGTWYVDAGLGDALYEPLALRPGEHHQAPLTLRLERQAERPDGVGEWHLVHDSVHGSFTGMSFRDAPAQTSAFSDKHRWLSTSPDSGFVRTVTVQRRDASGVDVLRGCVLRRIGDDSADVIVDQRAEWFDALGDVFGLRLDDVEAEARDALWARVSGAHATWSRER